MNVIVGVTGSIAAYKSAELVRLLTAAGHTVQVVMTQSAKQFIGEHTFQALTGNIVRSDLFDPAHEAAMGHIELARWADRILIAPATANTLAKVAHGVADDLLTTLVCAADCPVLVAPAMNQAMWRSEANLANVASLSERGVEVVGPDSGLQACGDDGPGRMIAPEHIAARIQLHDAQRLNICITAGPTHEPIDPVRYIANRSSGKMGYAVAQAFLTRGHNVTIVTGPVAIAAPPSARVIQVETAEQMLNAALAETAQSDIFVATAAVADYRVKAPASQKLKKSAGAPVLELIENPDVLATISQQTDRPFTVGFAAETHDLIDYAKKKLAAKKLDMIAANDVSAEGIGFAADENELHVLTATSHDKLARAAKNALAKQLVALILEKYNEKNHSS